MLNKIILGLVLTVMSLNLSSAAMWKLKVPGSEGLQVDWKHNNFKLWDGAGNEISSSVKTNAHTIDLLAVVTPGQVRAANELSSSIEGDTFYLELAAGETPKDLITEIKKQNSTKPFYATLAAHWAPVFHQDEDDDCPCADYITAVDFDGDFCGTNNWQNALDKKHAFQGNMLNEAVIYWWVVETTTHYYVGYADFHPRDWNDRDSLGNKFLGLYSALTSYDDQHENDLEGALVVIRKKSDNPFGQVELMFTQAHNEFWQYSNFKKQLKEKEGRENIDGELLLNDDNKPRLFIEAKGHGVYGSPKKTDYDGEGGDGRTYRYAGSPKDSKMKVLYWSLEADEESFLKPQASSNNGSRAPHWLKEGKDGEGRSLVDYSLRPITPLWNKQNTPLFTEGGAFRGTVHKDNAASPPWLWKDSDYEKMGLPTDIFFHEPAQLYRWLFNAKELGTVSSTVIGASYPRPSITRLLANRVR